MTRERDVDLTRPLATYGRTSAPANAFSLASSRSFGQIRVLRPSLVTSPSVPFSHGDSIITTSFGMSLLS